jgi:hypothetical protein
MHLALTVALVLTVSAVLSACAIGNVGTLAAKVERNGDVSVLDLYSVGLHLRTRPDDFGAHLGYSHRTYVFVSDDTLNPGWYFLRVPSLRRDAVAQDLMTVGIEYSAVAPLAGFTLGYSHDRLHARVPADESVYIEYAGGDTRVVRLEYCREEEPCEITLPSR